MGTAGKGIKNKTMNEKTLQQNIDSVIAEFEKQFSEWKIDDIRYARQEIRKFVSSFLTSHLSSSIQDFIRATEVEEKKYSMPGGHDYCDAYGNHAAGCNFCSGYCEKEILADKEVKGFNAAISAQKEKIKHYLGK